ncbi:lactonase family protein [Streptomyces sp. NPDC093085]|uniref:lactonase family protein n=1 Tax=Streptomyces sp. NPDC093085 TaxID=3155068 RepID=UPI0034261A0A
MSGEVGGGGGRVFIGSFTSAGGLGIIAADVDATTGALTARGATDTVADPSYLALSPDRTVVYAVSETDEGAVAAFRAPLPAPGGTGAESGARSGALQPLGDPVPVHGAGPTHLTVAGRHLLTANYGSGTVSVLPLGPDGRPGPVTGVLRNTGAGPDPDRQSGPHAHQVVAAPGGRHLLVVDLGTDSVRVCALDPRAGALVPYRETALRPGTGPRHLVCHPAGRHVYVLGELAPVLTVCRWDPVHGVLEPVGEVPVHPVHPGDSAHPGDSVHPGGADPAPGRSYPSEVVVAPDGRFLWVASRGGDTLTVLALDPTYEHPEPVTTVACGGRWPRDLVLGPTGRRLYVANERSGDVTWFDLDPATGIPAPAGALPAPAASRVLFG